MYKVNKRGNQKPSARKTDGRSVSRTPKRAGESTWKRAGGTTDSRTPSRSGFARRSDAVGSSSPRTRTSSAEGSYGRKKEYAGGSDARATRRPFDRAEKGDYKKSYTKNTSSRSGGGRNSSSRQQGGRGRNNRKKPVYDHRQFIKEATIQNENTKPYIVKHHFADFKFHEKLQRNITSRGYVNPTAIQDQAILPIMTGRDVIGIANTGTGKTAAFLLPLIHKICNDPTQQVLILAPTRELALQIDEECQLFTKNMQIQTIVCIGGTSMQKQLRSVRRKAHIIIGTPGRTKDLMQRKALQLSQVNNIVLDEVDRMLDMGFIDDITLLLSMVKKDRQSLFFSATMDTKIAKLTLNYSHQPVTIEIASRPTSENVHQDVIFVTDGDDKLDKLHTLLQKKECDKALVFSRTKMGAKRLAQKLHQRGLRADAIHGDLSQGQRQRALTAFRNDHLNVLVATDVVARGIDIDGITHVINYDLPENYEDYIHRIGRTGRGSSIGYALTFFER